MYYLESDNLKKDILILEIFDAQLIKNKIIEHLKINNKDLLILSKDNGKSKEMIDFFEVNPKNDKISKIITKGNKTYYKSLVD